MNTAVSLRRLTFLLVVFLVSNCPGFAKKPPRIVENLRKEKVFARVGENVELVCPVPSNPETIFDWEKDGIEITRYGWINYRSAQNLLLINHVTLEDAGEIVCQATNGFGSIRVTIQLFVYDNEIGTEVQQSYNSRTGEIPKGQEKPTFLQLAKYHRRMIQRPAGSSAKLKCTPSGNPKPVVTWLKDGTPLRNKDLLGKSKIRRNTLNLENLQPSDSGRYTCVLTNVWGTINATFSLEVIERILKKPQLVGPHPINTTVTEGETAFFICQMHSHHRPLIQWLKQVPPNTKRSRLVTEVDDSFYVVLLNTSKFILDPSGVYTSKLVIQNVSKKDAGTYACIGANTNGFNYTTAHLTVKGSPYRLFKWKIPVQQHNSSADSISVRTQMYDKGSKIIIIAVVVIIIIISLLVVRTCCKKYKSEEVTTKSIAVNSDQRQIKVPNKTQDPYPYSKFHQALVIESNFHPKQLIHGDMLPSVHGSDHSADSTSASPSSTIYISGDAPSDIRYETISTRHHHYYLN